jgi:hypothetical protein
MPRPLEPKSPDESKTYGIDWRGKLTNSAQTLTITVSTWDLPTGITSDLASIVNGHALVRIVGGAAGEDVVLTNTVTLSNGDVRKAAILVRIRALSTQ